MSKVSATSRADLLRLRARLGTVAEAAALLAFHRHPSPARRVVPGADAAAAETPGPRDVQPPAAAAEPGFPTARPPLPFLMAVAAAT